MWNITPAPAGWPASGLNGAHQGRSARRARRSSETYSVGRRSRRSRSRSSTHGSPSRRTRSAATRGCENSRLLARSLCSACLAMGGTVRQRRVGAKRTKAEILVRDRPCRRHQMSHTRPTPARRTPWAASKSSLAFLCVGCQAPALHLAAGGVQGSFLSHAPPLTPQADKPAKTGLPRRGRSVDQAGSPASPSPNHSSSCLG